MMKAPQYSYCNESAHMAYGKGVGSEKMIDPGSSDGMMADGISRQRFHFLSVFSFFIPVSSDEVSVGQNAK